MTNRQNNRKAAAAKTAKPAEAEPVEEVKTLLIESTLTYPLVASYKKDEGKIGEFMIVPKDVQLEGQSRSGRTPVAENVWKAALAANPALGKRVADRKITVIG